MICHQLPNVMKTSSFLQGGTTIEVTRGQQGCHLRFLFFSCCLPLPSLDSFLCPFCKKKLPFVCLPLLFYLSKFPGKVTKLGFSAFVNQKDQELKSWLSTWCAHLGEMVILFSALVSTSLHWRYEE